LRNSPNDRAGANGIPSPSDALVTEIEAMNATLPAHLLMTERRPVPAEMITALKARFGERCSTAQAVREQHGRDESPFEVAPPDAVVFARALKRWPTR